MAEIKISQLRAKAANLDATDLLEVSEVSGLSYVSKKITGQEIIDGVLSYTTLQSVTDEGNTTSNDIQFDAAVGILLDNGSRLREGTIDAGTGGTKGIAQICGVGYELKWEAGSQYVMNGSGDAVRIVNYKFDTAPTVDNDVTEGFYVGSRWILDNGTIYTCSDSTTGAAVWDLQLEGTVTSVSALTIGTTGTDITSTVATGTTTPVITLNVPTASATNRGVLSTTDWSAFNAKASYTPRVQSVTSSATVTPTNLNDLVKITTQAAALALANPTGTWDEGQPLMIRIKDNGTARAITFDTNYRAIGVTLPTTTVISKTTYLGIIYNSTDTKWDVIGVTTQA